MDGGAALDGCENKGIQRIISMGSRRRYIRNE